MNIVHKVEVMLTERLRQFPNDGTTIEQVMTDLAVIVLSNMRPCEVDTALFMSLGREGVADLLASRVGGSNNG